MNWLTIAGEVLSAILPTVIAEVTDYVDKVRNGQDVTDSWVRSKIPDTLQVEIQDRILTEKRREAGLPT